MSLQTLKDNLRYLRKKLPVESILKYLRQDGTIDEDEEERILAQKSNSDKVDMLIMDIIVKENRVSGLATLIHGLRMEKLGNVASHLQLGGYYQGKQEDCFEVDVKYQRIFECARDRLIRDNGCLITPPSILPALRAKNMICLDEEQVICAEDTTAAQTRKLIDFLWHRGSRDVYEELLRALKEQKYDRAIKVLHKCEALVDKECS